MFSRITRTFILSICAVAACGLAQAQITYSLINLGTLGGGPGAGQTPYSYAASINNAGVIVGSSYTSSYQQHAFKYENGVMTDLVTAYGTGFIQAAAISNSGQIVGGNNVSISSGGVRTTTTGIAPTAVNASGLIVGTDLGYPAKAVTYSNGTITNLGTFGGDWSVAYGVNTAGKVVGYAGVLSGQANAFLYSGGTMTNLGTLGGSESIAYDINDYDQIVGNARNASGYNHAFLYQNGVMTDLGTLDGLATTQSLASAINSSGQIVGYSNIGSVSQHAILYQNGVMIDLNTLFTSTELHNAGFDSLTWATDINDSGQIVGYGRVFGGDYSSTRAFLINVSGTAVPEPATCAALAGLAAFSAGVVRRRRS